MSGEKETPQPLGHLAEDIGALARSTIEMQQLGVQFLLAEVNLVLHAVPGLPGHQMPGQESSVSPQKGDPAKSGQDPDRSADLFDNMPV
jgi:hypothetical protein